MIIGLAALFGLLFGSFANVAIYRWPRGGTVTQPRGSACPHCGAEIAAYDNIPVVSWLVLRGRCRHCGGAIHWRYPLVETATGALFGAVAAVVGAHWILLPVLAVAWSVVVATAIDLEHLIIPNRMTYPLAPATLVLVVAALALDGDGARITTALVAGLAVPLGMLALSEGFRLLRGKPGIGMGDIKWAPALALTLAALDGWRLVVWFYGSVFSAAFVALVLMAIGRARLATRIPFGPYLGLGWLVAVLAGGPLARAVQSYLGV